MLFFRLTRKTMLSKIQSEYLCLHIHKTEADKNGRKAERM